MRIAARNEARFKIGDTVIKGCLRRVCSKESKGFSFNKTFFNAWWVARGKMCVLKGFSRLVMCSDVKDRFVSESFSSEISAVNLIVGWKLLACFMNRFISFMLESHNEKMSSM